VVLVQYDADGTDILDLYVGPIDAHARGAEHDDSHEEHPSDLESEAIGSHARRHSRLTHRARQSRKPCLAP
jgi:hypothetical protein